MTFESQLTCGIVINKCWPKQRALVVIIILLYVLTTINFAANWAFTCSAYIENGQSFWTVYSKLGGVNQAAYLETGIAASMATILSDSYIVRATPLVIIPVSLPSFLL